MKTIILLFQILLLVQFVYSQESKIKFGKISQDDLAIKTYEADPEASALVLSDIGLVRYEIIAISHPIVRFHHVAIKILNKRGIEEFGNVIIPYYKFDRGSYITNLRANVHLPNGTVIKLKNEHFIDEEINKFYGAKKIAFPSVEVGAILEYDYQLSSNDFFSPVDWYFQGKAPIRYAELVVKIPNWFDYVILSQGQRLNQNSQTQERDSGSDIIYSKWTYVAKDMPALKEESYITTMKDYYSRIKFRLNSYQIPRQLKQNVMNSWEKVSETLWAIPSFGYQLNNNRPGELVLEAAGVSIRDTGDQLTKAIKVYHYINHNLELESWSSIGTSMEIQEILKKRSGTGGHLNKLMLAALLQLGIDAYPVLISSREHGRALELYPFIDQFDHMLVLANLDGKETWIDLGNQKRPLGHIAARSLNSRGWVAAKKNPYWVSMPAMESKTIYIIKGDLSHTGFFSADVEARFTGFHALIHRWEYSGNKQGYFKDHLAFSSSHAAVTDLEVINEMEYDKPFQIKGKLKDLPYGDVGNEKIYLSQLLPASLMELPFKQENREYPVEYNYAEDYTVIVDISIPENYVLEYLPKSAKYVTEENGTQVSLQTSSLSNKINLITKFANKQLVYSQEDYLMLKNIYDLRKELFTEQIVISKAR